MRRHHLSKLGFHTGSPFVAADAITRPRSESLTRPSSLQSRTNSSAGAPAAVSRAASTSGARSTSTQIPMRRTGSAAAPGKLDPGRLALARSQYEDRRAAAAGTRSAAEAGSSAAAAASRPATSAAASSAPVSRQSSSVKRRRESSEEESDTRDTTQREEAMSDDDDKDEASEDAAAPSAKRRKAASDTAPALRRGISAELPPLETAAGNRIDSATGRPSFVLPSTPQSELPSSAPNSAPSSPAPAASSSQPTTPASASGPLAGVDLRQKTRNMLEQVMRDAAAMPDPAAVRPAVKPEPNVEPPGAAAQATPATSYAPALHVHTFSSLAIELESMMLLVCGSQLGTAYRQRLRSLLFNMRRNVGLTHRLLRGSLTAYQLSQMSEEELADPATQAEREALKAENLSAAMSRTAQRMETRDYKCAQCGGNDCSTRVIREERDISKADTWGSKQGAGSVIDIQCNQCKHAWTKEE